MSVTLLRSVPSFICRGQVLLLCIYSELRLSARSSIDAWVEPQDAEADLTPNDLGPLGFGHPLWNIWGPTVGPEAVCCLDDRGAEFEYFALRLDPYTSGTQATPLRRGRTLLDSPTAEVGVKVAGHFESREPFPLIISTTFTSNCLISRYSAPPNYTSCPRLFRAPPSRPCHLQSTSTSVRRAREA